MKNRYFKVREMEIPQTLVAVVDITNMERGEVLAEFDRLQAKYDSHFITDIRSPEKMSCFEK